MLCVVEALLTVKSKVLPPLQVAKSGSFIVSIKVASGNCPIEIVCVAVSLHPVDVLVTINVIIKLPVLLNPVPTKL